ncbi:telomerase reverse transcriptase isoform X1 [Ipomoea triloba]|uniref:telomerase reverse transcriptase isoform X1 n=1 Tax=Ipomoea triloba TaxID=35885 RepID=UPI00125DB52C|nr:telomerase reverse transcriptase isoform X1 [Ipomoea triloba]
MANKKRRVPDVLWRVFRNRARTLSDTIKSLLPPPPPSAAHCLCNGRRCLGCSGANAMEFLLRPTDTSDYRKLLKHCFVVIDENAPSFSVFDPHHRWSQIQIVRRTIESMRSEKSTSSNILCCGNDKMSFSSVMYVEELLTSSAWCLLLRRIGDALMVYLLRNASIFLPLSQKKLHQVAGFPITDLCFSSSIHTTFGSGKRKRFHDMQSMPVKQQCPRQRCIEEESSKGTLTSSGDNCTNKGVHLLSVSQGSLNQDVSLNRKRRRLHSWQRQRKRQQLPFQETNSLTTCRNSMEKGDLPVTLQHEINVGITGWCSCCLAFSAPLNVTEDAIINTRTMFYKLESCSSVFPRKHILNSLKPNSSGANDLFKEIFGSYSKINGQISPCLHSTNCCFIRSTCLYHSLTRLLKALIRKAQHCQHLRLLEKHCPVPSFDEDGKRVSCSDYQVNLCAKGCTAYALGDEFPEHCFSSKGSESPEAQHSQLRPSKCYSLKKQVVSFVWAVCRSIVPLDLLGTPSNWRILRKNISKFIQMRRFEKFSLNQCMHKVKISRFPLLSNKYNSNSHGLRSTNGCFTDMYKECGGPGALDIVKHKVLECWMFWFFSCLVVPLVQAHFYVTETEHENQEILYYRKSIWKQVKVEAMTCLKDQQFLELNVASAQKILKSRSFGFSKVRFLPKKDGLRILENLKASSRMPVKLSSQSCEQRKVSLLRNIKYDYFRSVNCALRGLHAVLKGIQTKEPAKLGSSVFNYNDVYNKLVPFLLILKNGSATAPDVFIVVSDVAKAFDSINQDKLLTVMEDFISDNEYILAKTIEVVCTKKSLWINQHLALSHESSTSSLAARPFHGILVKQEKGRKVMKDELTFYLKEHIKHNVLHMDNKFYLQGLGIPQGSVLSSLLCSLYYGYLEKNLIIPFLKKACKPTSRYQSGIETFQDAAAAECGNGDKFVVDTPKYLLLRFIDDFLFISTSKFQASSFLTRLQRGFREFNCYMNEEKFGLNFDINHLSGLQSSKLYVGDDGISFLRWSGLFVNCRTLEIQADYTRYLNIHLSSTLTISWQGKPVRELKSKLCCYLRPKCHRIFYDSNINSAAVVRLNIYQSFLLCAMKFHCYISGLASIVRLSTNSYIDVLETSLRYMKKLIKKRMELNSGIQPVLEVEKWEIEWLGLIAYIRVLNKKQSRYRALLPLLRSKLIAVRNSECVSSALKYATDDVHSSVLWKIRY